MLIPAGREKILEVFLKDPFLVVLFGSVGTNCWMIGSVAPEMRARLEKVFFGVIKKKLTNIR